MKLTDEALREFIGMSLIFLCFFGYLTRDAWFSLGITFCLLLPSLLIRMRGDYRRSINDPPQSTPLKLFLQCIAIAVLAQLAFLGLLAWDAPEHMPGQWDSRLGSMWYVGTQTPVLIQFAILLLPAAVVGVLGLFGKLPK